MPRGRKLDIEWLKQHYPMMTDIDHLLDDYEAEFGWRPTKRSVYVKTSRLGIHKLPVAGRDGRSERPIRWSKEPELEAWMLEHDHGQRIDVLADEFEGRFGFRINRSQINIFRASHGTQTRRSHGGGRHRVPVGFERESKDGYLVIKVAEEATVPMSKDNWRLKHVWLWEQDNGPLPEGHMVMFADGDRRNFAKDNLVAVPTRLMAVMNNVGVEWHDRESLLAAVAIAEMHVERTRIERQRPRVCKCCGKPYTNEGRANPVATICPECGRKGRKPPNSKRKPKYDRDRMRELSAQGKTNQEIADELGCSQVLVSQVLTGELDRRKQQRKERWK
jgi:hypothetical protein